MKRSLSELCASVSLWFNRLGVLFRRKQLDTEMAEEMRAHLDAQTQRNVAAGMSPDDAHTAAHRQFGGVAQVQERARELRGGLWVESFGRDLRFAARSLRRQPGFALLAIATLALGIGVTTIVFSVAKGILLRPLLFPRADQLAWIFSYNAAQDVANERVSAAEFDDLHAQSRSFSALATINGWSLRLDEGERPEFLHGLMVRPELFDVLGIEPVAGRRLLPSDNAGADGVMLISHELWQRRFAGSPDIMGTTVRVDRTDRRTIVGVLPAGLEFPLARSPQAGNGSALAAGGQDFWLPRPVEAADRSQQHRSETVIARLRTGVALGEAQAELRSIAHSLAVAHPKTNTGWGFAAVAMREQILGRTGPALTILLVAVGLVLLLVCANVGNLLLCRGLSRQTELAVRVALGAGRSRILRQLLVETLLLAVGGGIVGLGAAYGGLQLLVALSPASIPFLHEVTLDGTMLATAFVLAAISGLIAGLAPAWRFARIVPQTALRQRTAQTTDSGGAVAWRNRLVVAQVAATVVLVSTALLLTRSFVRLMNVDLGYRPAPVLTAELALETASSGADLRGALFAQLQDQPWITAAGAVHSVPLTGVWAIRDGFGIKGQPEPRDGRRQAALSFIGFDYFQAMGIPLLRGRTFDRPESLDLDNAPVAIVNESFARRYFPSADALGQIILAPGTRERRIVGIVKDTRDIRMEIAAEPHLYLPLMLGDLKLVVQTTENPARFIAQLPQVVAAVDPQVLVTRVTPMSSIVSGLLAERRFVVVLLTVFATLALLLGGVGIYGVLAFAVAQRRREIGIRTALGAQVRDIEVMILVHGARLTWPGAVLGLAGAVAVLRFLENQLFELRAHDVASYAGAVGAVGVIALIATLLPARRAARVDPVSALHAD